MGVPSVLSTDRSSSGTRFLQLMLFTPLLLRGGLSNVVIATTTLPAVLAVVVIIVLILRPLPPSLCTAMSSTCTRISHLLI